LKTKASGESQGFAFVTVPAHFAESLLKLNAIEFYGQQLVIEESKTDGKKKSPQKKGGKGGQGKGKGGQRGGGRWKRKNYNKYETPNIPEDQKFDIIDGGANLTNPKFHHNKDLVFRRAREAGVTKIVVTGLKLNGCKSAENMSVAYSNTFAAVGIHPHFVKDDWMPDKDAACDEISTLAKAKGVVAIGEIGLDYCKCYSEKEAMKEAFESQVKIAVENNKTLLVHDREASADIIATLSKHKIVQPVVIYCMTGAVEQIKDYVSRGYYIGITGFMCKEPYGKHIREAITNKDLPLNKIIVHSDAPYMVPNKPLEEQDEVTKALLNLCFNANEPMTLNITVREIATCLAMPAKSVADQLVTNAELVYKFPKC
jgi:TatD DNase family protein